MEFIFRGKYNMKKPFTLLSSLLLAVTFCLSFSVTAAALESTAGETAYFAYFSSEKPYSNEQLVENRNTYSYKIEDGNLYKVEYTSRGTYLDKSYQLLVDDGCVTDFAISSNDLVFAMNGSLYSSNWDATDVSFIFALPQSIDGEIEMLFANDYLIWFQVNDCIYRLYRQNNTLDFVYSNPDILWWRPVSNYSIEYAVYSEEYLKAKQEGKDPDSMSFYNEQSVYQYNAHTEKTFLESLESPDSRWQLTPMAASDNVSHYTTYSATIAGKRIPESSYPIGSFISSSGQKCRHHSVTNNDNCDDKNGSCGCLVLGNSLGLGFGIQCSGFAKQIYWDLFGTDTGTLTYDKKIKGEAKDFFTDLHPGALIRSRGHSLIFIKATSTYVDFYHANYQAACQVSVSRFTYDDIEYYYSTLTKLYSPDHTYSNKVSTYDATRHYYKCTETNCNGKMSEIHSFVASGNKQVCSVCKYSVVVSR